MGYKSTLRSINAAGKRAEADARRRKREKERQQKRQAKINEKMLKIFDELENLYAKGKIDKKEFDQLKKRQADISVDLVIFGKTPGVTLGKRYVTGKITQEEFDKMQADILPPEVYLEKEKIKAELYEIHMHQKSFRKDCKFDTGCARCGTEGSLINSVKDRGDENLCRKCFKIYRKLSNYRHDGEYYLVNKGNIPYGGTVDITVKPEHY